MRPLELAAMALASSLLAAQGGSSAPGDPAAPAAEATGVTVVLPAFDHATAFLTPGGDGVLRAEETGVFRVELRNLEPRAYTNVRVSYRALVPLEGLAAAGTGIAGDLGPLERRVVELPVASDIRMPTGVVDYVLEVAADGGAYGPPARVSVRTRAFVPPRLEILAAGRRRLGERVWVSARIQNLGGPARDVSARFISTEPGILLDSTASLSIGDLANGQSREVAAEVALSADYLVRAEMPLWLEVRERHAAEAIREKLTIPLGGNESLTNIATGSAR